MISFGTGEESFGRETKEAGTSEQGEQGHWASRGPVQRRPESGVLIVVLVLQYGFQVEPLLVGEVDGLCRLAERGREEPGLREGQGLVVLGTKKRAFAELGLELELTAAPVEPGHGIGGEQVERALSFHVGEDVGTETGGEVDRVSSGRLAHRTDDPIATRATNPANDNPATIASRPLVNRLRRCKRMCDMNNCML